MEVGDKFIDLDGHVATIISVDPLEYEVFYIGINLTNTLSSPNTLERFIPLTELNKALV